MGHQLTLDVVTITKASKLLLPSSVPDIEEDFTPVGVEGERVHFHPESGHIFLFELPSQMALYKSCLAHTTISHQHELERNPVVLCHVCNEAKSEVSK